jgi:hypothetical protein
MSAEYGAPGFGAASVPFGQGKKYIGCETWTTCRSIIDLQGKDVLMCGYKLYIS